jgi:large conductance mechanosensitive channel
MLQEFKKFVMRGNVIDLAVGVIIGAAFSSVVQSLVEDIIMPPIGLLLGSSLDFTRFMLVLSPELSLNAFPTKEAAVEAGAVGIYFGQFITQLFSFLITALAIFLLVRAINRMYAARQGEATPAEPVVKECPFCIKDIPINASRCPFCTSELEAGSLRAAP